MAVDEVTVSRLLIEEGLALLAELKTQYRAANSPQFAVIRPDQIDLLHAVIKAPQKGK